MPTPKTYSRTYLTPLQSTSWPIERRLAALPEYERVIVEGMVTALVDELHGVGRQTALELIWAAGRWVRRLERL